MKTVYSNALFSVISSTEVLSRRSDPVCLVAGRSSDAPRRSLSRKQNLEPLPLLGIFRPSLNEEDWHSSVLIHFSYIWIGHHYPCTRHSKDWHLLKKFLALSSLLIALLLLVQDLRCPSEICRIYFRHLATWKLKDSSLQISSSSRLLRSGTKK